MRNYQKILLVLFLVAGTMPASVHAQIALTKEKYDSTYREFGGLYHFQRAMYLDCQGYPVYSDDIKHLLSAPVNQRLTAALEEVRLALAHPKGLDKFIIGAKSLEISILNKLFRFNAIERNGISLSPEAMAYYLEAKDLCERYEKEYCDQTFSMILLEIQNENGFIWEALASVNTIEHEGTRNPHIYELKGELLLRLGLEEEAGIAFERWIDLQGQEVHRTAPPELCLTTELHRLKMTYGHPANMPKAWIPKKKKGELEIYVPRRKY
jgi:tetratricopeptide (TPR) repeat protein